VEALGTYRELDDLIGQANVHNVLALPPLLRGDLEGLRCERPAPPGARPRPVGAARALLERWGTSGSPPSEPVDDDRALRWVEDPLAGVRPS
jgi:hypothetical protein